MSTNNIFTTQKGTNLPLISLKGKPYMSVAHRLVWFTEDVPFYDIETKFLFIDNEQTVAQTTVIIKDEKGNQIRKATSTKRETAKDFGDHTEKAETGSLGRALAALGYGTQFAIAEIEEGNRLVDSPVVEVKKETGDWAYAPILAENSRSIFDKDNSDILNTVKDFNKSSDQKFVWVKEIQNYVLFSKYDYNFDFKVDRITKAEYSSLLSDLTGPKK